MEKPDSGARFGPGAITVEITNPGDGGTVPSGRVVVRGHYSPAGALTLSVVLYEDGSPPAINPTNLSVTHGASASNFMATFDAVAANSDWQAVAHADNGAGDTGEDSVSFSTGN